MECIAYYSCILHQVLVETTQRCNENHALEIKSVRIQCIRARIWYIEDIVSSGTTLEYSPFNGPST